MTTGERIVAADTDFSCPVRFATTQPTQALGLINGQFTHDLARKMASRVGASVTSDESFVAEVLRRVTQRRATSSEIQLGLELMTRLRSEHQVSASDARSLFCLTALNLNEFIHLD